MITSTKGGAEEQGTDSSEQKAALAGDNRYHTSITRILGDKYEQFRGRRPDLYQAVKKLDTAYNKYFKTDVGERYIDALTKVTNEGKTVLKKPSELLEIEKTTKDKIISDISGNPVFMKSIDDSLSSNQTTIRDTIIKKVVGIVVNKKTGGFRTVRASRRLKKHKRSHKAKRTGKGKKTKKHGKRRASKTRKH